MNGNKQRVVDSICNLLETSCGYPFLRSFHPRPDPDHPVCSAARDGWGVNSDPRNQLWRLSRPRTFPLFAAKNAKSAQPLGPRASALCPVEAPKNHPLIHLGSTVSLQTADRAVNRMHQVRFLIATDQHPVAPNACEWQSR